MNRKLAGLLITLLILTILLATNNPILPKAHASVIGLLCLADPTFFTPGASNACPTPPVVFTGPNSPKNQLKIAVNINSSDIFLGFDITLKADHTILTPADANLTGSVLSGSSATVKCIGIVQKIGVCQPTDTPDTIHFAASQTNTITTTGLLFTAIFNVTARQTSGTRLGFQTGCGTPTAPTSIAPGVSSVCITMINGSLTPTAETFQEASFSNQPGFAISATRTSISLDRGASTPTMITVTSVLNFNGTVALTKQVSPSGLGATLTLQSLKVNSTKPANSTTLTISAASPTTLQLYLINVTGTSGSTVLFTVISVNVVDFTISASPTSLTISVGKNDSSTVTLTGQNGYLSPITLTTTTNATAGLAITCTASIISIFPPSPSTLKCTFIPSSAGSYNATITASDGTISHSQFVIIKALPSGAADFAINTFPTNVRLPVGGLNQTVLIATSISGLSATVSLTATTTGTGLTVSPSHFSLQLSPGTANFTILTFAAATSAATGPYQVSITGIAQGITRTAQLTVVVFPDFSISTSPPAITVNVGSSAKSNVTLTNRGNLGTPITLSTQSSPNGLISSLNSTTINLTGISAKGATLTVNAPNGTSPGVYIVTVKATVGFITHNITLTVNVVLHDVIIVSVNANTSTATEGARVTYNIVVQNRGTVSENLTVNALVGGQTVNATSLVLQPGEARAVTLTWNTSNFTPGAYTLGAKVLKVPGQSSTANNIVMSASTFNLTAPPTSSVSQDLLLIIAISAAIVAVAIIGLVLFRRRTSAKTTL